MSESVFIISVRSGQKITVFTVPDIQAFRMSLYIPLFQNISQKSELNLHTYLFKIRKVNILKEEKEDIKKLFLKLFFVMSKPGS